MDAYYREYRASIHRGVYPLAALATEAYEGARAKVAAFAGSTPGETIFTRNATEAINLVAYSWGAANVGRRRPDRGHRDGAPLQPRAVAAAVRAHGRRAGVRADRRRGPARRGRARRAARARAEARRRRARLQRARHGQPGRRDRRARARRRRGRAGRRLAGRAAPACRRRRARRRLLRLDGAQGLRADRHRRAARPPRAARGDAAVPRRRAHDRQGRRSSRRRYAEPPTKFEAGTSPIAEAVGLGAAVDYLGGFGMAAVLGALARRRRLRARSGSARSTAWRSTARPTSARRGSVVSFALDGIHPHDVAEILGREGVCVRAGHHCAQVLMRRLGVAATTRASFAVHSTHDDVDRLVERPRHGPGDLRS